MSCATNNRAALRRLLRDQSGASALEMALILPIMILMLIGVMEFARFTFTQQLLRTVTAEAARLSAVNSSFKSGDVTLNGSTITSCDTSSSLNARAVAKTPFIDPTQLSLCVSNTTSGNDMTIIVSTTYPFKSFLPKTSFLTTTLSDSTKITYRVQ